MISGKDSLESSKVKVWARTQFEYLASKDASERAIGLFSFMKELRKRGGGRVAVAIGNFYQVFHPLLITGLGIFFRCSEGCQDWHPLCVHNTTELIFNEKTFNGKSDDHMKSLNLLAKELEQKDSENMTALLRACDNPGSIEFAAYFLH